MKESHTRIITNIAGACLLLVVAAFVPTGAFAQAGTCRHGAWRLWPQVSGGMRWFPIGGKFLAR